MSEKELSCIDCGSQACRGKGGLYPDFCLTSDLDPALLNRSIEILTTEENEFAIASAANEHEGYCVRSRVEEIMHFAQLIGANRLGIATCVGLASEARQFARVLRAQGYEVIGVACKCGTVKKTIIGVPDECLKTGVNLCNPVLQALLLNKEKTELNIAIGLCVGHDSLFYKYSDAPVTTLASKDRLLCHNPLGPLYLLDGYWKKLLQEDSYLKPKEVEREKR